MGNKNADNTNEELSRSKFRKIKNPNNNNTVAAAENADDVQQEPNIEDFATQYLELTSHSNQLLSEICKKLDVIVELLLKKKKMEKSNENLEEEEEEENEQNLLI